MPSELIGEVQAMIWQTVHAGFGYFQKEVGYTRAASARGTQRDQRRADERPGISPAGAR